MRDADDESTTTTTTGDTGAELPYTLPSLLTPFSFYLSRLKIKNQLK